MYALFATLSGKPVLLLAYNPEPSRESVPARERRGVFNPMRGFFITLEGVDGCGKSTQLTMLARALERRGYDSVVTREPGGTPLGEKIRDLLLSNESVGIAATTELFLMSAARAQHVEQVIKPGKEAGRIVISDRHIDSTVAFQGYGRGLDLAMIEAVNSFATGGLLPDLTIVLDIKPEVARLRLGSRPVGGWLGAVDEEQAEFHRRVREGYLKLAEASPERVRIVDAGGSVQKTHEQVLSLVLSIL